MRLRLSSFGRTSKLTKPRLLGASQRAQLVVLRAQRALCFFDIGAEDQSAILRSQCRRQRVMERCCAMCKGVHCHISARDMFTGWWETANRIRLVTFEWLAFV